MKKIVILILLIAFGTGVYFFWSYQQQKRLLAESGYLELYGNIEIRRVNLGFRVSGRIESLRFQEGDKIEKGEILATLDPIPYQDSLAVAQAQLERAEADYEKLQSGMREQEIEQARATLQERIASLIVLEADCRRAKPLFERSVISAQEYEKNVARRDEAIARRDLAQATLDLLLEGYRKEDIAAGKAAVSEARANLKKAETSLGDTKLLCPNEGVLLTRVEEPGAVVREGQIVATVSIKDQVWAYVYIPDPDRGKVDYGMKAEIYTDSRPGIPYFGQIGFISPEAEFTPKNVETKKLRTDLVYRIRIIADAPDFGLGQGIPVTVRILLKQ